MRGAADSVQGFSWHPPKLYSRTAAKALSFSPTAVTVIFRGSLNLGSAQCSPSGRTYLNSQDLYIVYAVLHTSRYNIRSCIIVFPREMRHTHFHTLRRRLKLQLIQCLVTSGCFIFKNAIHLDFSAIGDLAAPHSPVYVLTISLEYRFNVG